MQNRSETPTSQKLKRFYTKNDDTNLGAKLTRYTMNTGRKWVSDACADGNICSAVQRDENGNNAGSHLKEPKGDRG